jgi:hypothetical protein
MKIFLPKRNLILVILLLVTSISYSQNNNQELKITDYVIPYPRNLEKTGNESLFFNTDIKAEYTGKTSTRLTEYVSRLDQRIKTAFGVYKTLIQVMRTRKN